MRRTQLYLDDNLWQTLQKQAKITGSTVSELVRAALREKYSVDIARRVAAIKAVKGLWADRTDIGDPKEYVRKLRRDNRLERFKR